jgi:hypothetical protein
LVLSPLPSKAIVPWLTMVPVALVSMVAST